MFHLWVIALFMAIVWRDMIDHPLAAGMVTNSGIVLATLGPMLGVMLAVHLLMRRAVLRLEATGAYGAIRVAESALAASRWAAVAAFAFGVIALGWLDVVRSVVGDLILVDELIAMAPALLVFISGWSSAYPIERVIREATLYKALHAEDEESVLYQIPTRLEFVLLNVRHQLLLTMTPLLMLSTWAETVEFASRRAAVWAERAAAEPGSGVRRSIAELLAHPDVRTLGAGVLQLAGIVCVFILAPALLRVVWDTVRLGDSEVRTRLLELCRAQGIKVRDILIWRTHGTLMNGAVMGLIPRVRYVMLTDVMLDTMPTRELEAVMAHELAHVKHRHIIWLALTLMTSVSVAATLATLMPWALGVGLDRLRDEGIMELTLTAAALAAGMTVFGFTSRRFEWQADAFGAACMSRAGEGDAGAGEGEGSARRITPAGAAAMIGALELVAKLNHIAHEAPSWRHGSIGVRQAKLARIVGEPLDRLSSDRTPRIIKRVVGALLALIVAAAIVEFAGGLGT